MKNILLSLVAAFFSLLSVSAERSYIEKLSVDIYNQQMKSFLKIGDSELWQIKEGGDFY